MLFDTKSYFTSTEIFNNKIKLQSFLENTNFILVREKKSFSLTGIKIYLNGLEQLNFHSLSAMAKSIRSGTEHNNKTTVAFPNSR